MSDYVAILIHNLWFNRKKQIRAWEETLRNCPGQAEAFKEIAEGLSKEIKPMDEYHKMCSTIASLIHQSVRCTGLEMQNHRQAGMLMERDLTIRQLEEELRMRKQQEEKDIKDNIIEFNEARLALATKEPPVGGNWLSTLKKGTRFLVSKKSYPEPVLGDFWVGSDPMQMKAVYLGYDMGSKEFGFKFFDPVVFSQLYTLYDVIQTEVEQDGNINSIPAGSVEGDGQPQNVPPVHEGK